MEIEKNTLIQRLSSLDIQALRWLLTRELFPQLAVFGRVISTTADGYLYPLILLALLFMGTTHEYQFGLAMLGRLCYRAPALQNFKGGF